jgi:hypothetical protein
VTAPPPPAPKVTWFPPVTTIVPVPVKVAVDWVMLPVLESYCNVPAEPTAMFVAGNP